MSHRASYISQFGTKKVNRPYVKFAMFFSTERLIDIARKFFLKSHETLINLRHDQRDALKYSLISKILFSD